MLALRAGLSPSCPWLLPPLKDRFRGPRKLGTSQLQFLYDVQGLKVLALGHRGPGGVQAHWEGCQVSKLRKKPQGGKKKIWLSKINLVSPKS